MSNPKDKRDDVTTDNPQTLELLAERLVVDTQKMQVGKVILEKVVRTKTVNVPVELTEEYLSIRIVNNNLMALPDTVMADDDTPATVLMNGTPMSEPMEILISKEVAKLSKETHVAEEINLHKYSQNISKTISDTVQHEELVVTGDEFLDKSS
ncbi:YsnF/AvaK domain-containing protein [Moraxella bovis]|uniref:YsnF/AvaK domain-containing protein n=1 Tax=Moraxella bovis TaxID=476 RepID=UPI0022276D47|nr:YsnF/AvaK domain-containing protein [Moraxella bovis]UYZ68416.1 YsnF/AvaK domain-containing protein [Moraxella bovis]UYZ70789.1 YsnF/AvaK domain-containing protein [Moraxella bovis]UYZ73279.1 YsnF/AvaK domain-containing protein [Moraxella bovis]UZA14097.1 YsnF/AvaK domain-containing protein [Moraxella bovis]UZA27550.1 YsnF/AvaK domain-containing protein [Moraxella bovis]